jgi:hypothetical protein
MDVDHESDYKEMVKKIEGSNPTTTKIFVDMKEVQKLPTLGDLEDKETKTTDDNVGEVCTHLLCCSNISLTRSTECIAQSCGL